MILDMILDALHAACVFLSLYYFLAGVGATSAQIRTTTTPFRCVLLQLCIFSTDTLNLTMILSLFSSTIYFLHRNCVLVPQASSMIRCSISAMFDTLHLLSSISHRHQKFHDVTYQCKTSLHPCAQIAPLRATPSTPWPPTPEKISLRTNRAHRSKEHNKSKLHADW